MTEKLTREIIRLRVSALKFRSNIRTHAGIEEEFRRLSASH